MKAVFARLLRTGVLDAQTVLFGLEREWIGPGEVTAYAIEQVRDGKLAEEALQLLSAEELSEEEIARLLRQSTRESWPPHEDARLAPMRRWMLAALEEIEESPETAEDQLDRIEDLYGQLGYPEEMRECSRYYVPASVQKLANPLGAPVESPLKAMSRLISRLRLDLRAENPG